MAWRDYTDPNTLQTWSTDDSGNFRQGSLEQLGLTRSAPINQMPDSGASYTAQPAATGGGLPSGGAQTQYDGYQTYQSMYNKLVGLGWRNPTTDPNGILSAYNGAYGGSGTKTGMTLAGGLDQATLAGSLAQQAAQQQYLRDRLNELEIPMSQAERQQGYAKLAMDLAAMTGYYGPSAGTAPGTQMSEEQALDAIAGSRDAGFWDFYKSNGYAVDTQEQKRAAVQNWITSADPRWKGMSAVAVASALGLGGTAAGEWGGLGGVAAGTVGATPTFAREQWNAANWQAIANLKASKTGPTNWAVYKQLQPEAAFGAMTGTPSGEQDFVRWFNAGQEPATVAFAQPNTVRPQDWKRWSPTRQQTELGNVSYNGIDPQDWWQNMASGWPTGRAAPTTTWA